MQRIQTSDAPKALGSYSQGSVSGSNIYTSGQIGIDPHTLKLAVGVEAQIRQVFTNISMICEAADSSLYNITKLTVYLVDKDDWSLVNTIMEELFISSFPSRTAVGVAWLPLGAAVEIEAIAEIPPNGKR
jgi:reactive intermediate/imine deaminase